jgi:hypothetical protein
MRRQGRATLQERRRGSACLKMAGEERLRSALNWLLTKAWTEANFCRLRMRRNRSIARSRRRNGRCEFSALLLSQRPVSWRSAEPSGLSETKESVSGVPQFGFRASLRTCAPVSVSASHPARGGGLSSCLRAQLRLQQPALRAQRSSTSIRSAMSGAVSSACSARRMRLVSSEAPAAMAASRRWSARTAALAPLLSTNGAWPKMQ